MKSAKPRAINKTDSFIRLIKTNSAYCLLIFFGLLMILIGITNHYYFKSFVSDYGNYNFAFWDYSHFRISSMPTYSGNFLQDHYSYLLFYLTPFYWLFNWLTGTYTLIIIQNVLITVAALYSYKLVQLRSDNIYLHVGVILYYFFLLGRYTTFNCDTNLAVMSACFIPIFLYFFKVEKYFIAGIIFLLSVFSRENIPLWFIFIFAVLLIEHRRNKKVIFLCLGGIIISTIYFIILFKVLIPNIENEVKHYTLFNYSALGNGPGEALKYVITHPISTFKLFFINHLNDTRYNYIKAEFYLVYLISGGFLLFFRPKYIIWFIPIVAQKVFNDAPVRWGIHTYYSIEIITLLPLSVFITLSEIKSVKIKNSLAVFICAITIFVTLYKLDRNNRVYHGTSRPEKEKFYDSRFYITEYDLKKTHKLINSIPKEARVSSSEDFFSFLAQREHIYYFPTVNDAEYIIFSVNDDRTLITHMDNEEARNKYLNSPKWQIINEVYPVFLLKRVPAGKITNNKPKAISFSRDTVLCNFDSYTSDGNYVVFDTGKIAETYRRISTNKSRSGNSSLLLHNTERYGNNIRITDLNDTDCIEASVWVKGDVKNANIALKNYWGDLIISNHINKNDKQDWYKITINYWLPKREENSSIEILLWNTGRDSVYFDDFEIINKKRL